MWPLNSSEEAANLLKRSLDRLPEVQEEKRASGDSDDVERFLKYYDRMSTINANLNRKPAPFWIHFIFVPVIGGAVIVCALVAIQPTSKENQALQQQAMTALAGALIGAIGFYAGKK
jgi:hypothetical protein